MIDKLKALFAAAKAAFAKLACKLTSHKRPAPSRWDEVPSREFTCTRCGEKANLW